LSKRFLTPVNLPKGVVLPSSGLAGDLFYNSAEEKVYVHDGITWSLAGVEGQTGATGDAGPTGPQGIAGFEYSDSRVGALEYVPGEIIVYLGVYYICIATNDAVLPTGAAIGVYWNVYSFVGSDGATGPTGPTGDVGPAGPAGSVGVSALTDLTDTNIYDPVDGDVLVYNSQTDTWINTTFFGILASFGLVTADGGSYNATEFAGTINGGLYNTTVFTSVVDGGNESNS
jgi:hypothetical protein